MMLFHLLKKDFLIVKKYVLIMFIVATIIPPFMLAKTPEYGGTLGFVLSAIFAIFMLLQYVSLKEYQFPKASTLLCATPFPRKLMVLSKYIFCITIYITCCVIFVIETLIFPQLGTADIELFLFPFFVISVFIGVYLPIQYKLGYEKTKFTFMVVIMASPVILPYFLKTGLLNFNFLFVDSSSFVYGGIVLVSLMILAISAFLSVKIYNKIDLA